MTDQEFDQLFDNGESILETLDLSTAHRINCPTDLMTNKKEVAQKILDAFNGYHEMVNRRVKIAAALREVVSQLQYQSFHHTEAFMQLDADDILELIEELEKL